MTTPKYQCVFSPCRKYRYTLINEWNPDKPRIMWIGLNPSTADEQKLDPTLTRIRKWSESWGYGSFVMTNLFAFRSPHPKVMQAEADPVGWENDRYIFRTARECQTVIAAWGNGGEYKGRCNFIARNLRYNESSLSCLGKTSLGHPIHPMARGKNRVPDNVTLIPF